MNVNFIEQWRLYRGIRTLNGGGIIAYPTEAVWGLGCDPWREASVRRILTVKQREESKGLILVASDNNAIAGFLQSLTESVRNNFAVLSDKASQSGRATTWLFPHDSYFPSWITGEHSTVAIRVTNHPIAAKLAAGVGGLLVSTSANPGGEEPAKTMAQAKRYFGGTIDNYVSGSLGDNTEPSAIIDLASGRRLR